ncbi:hypothetical protein HELRODRAFT_164219 [Helobdella robusta]|uniref:Uncharacterized protein n=1 Tax=Helobdella robusta TaxID=6412 RepID=T1EV41_HELRO|nr:hypothetical protein HELRODRAFT_164219 [Helobdella robusta]ESN94386.1 hypothetical protein HELRODRAFT_164219 [Helobdella robusta]
MDFLWKEMEASLRSAMANLVGVVRGVLINVSKRPFDVENRPKIERDKHNKEKLLPNLKIMPQVSRNFILGVKFTVDEWKLAALLNRGEACLILTCMLKSISQTTCLDVARDKNWQCLATFF